jgi:hypothetical protein
MQTESFNCVKVTMDVQTARNCSHAGPCDTDVVQALEDGDIRIDGTPDDIRRELKEYGAWDAEELANDEQNLQRIAWIAAGNIADQHNGRA